MKIRNGFVSNSSSSSFVCDICNLSGVNTDSNSLYPVCEDDTDTRFSCGHRLCSECFDKSKFIKQINAIDHDGGYSDHPAVADYYMDNIYCPICNFEMLAPLDMLRYFVGKQGIPDLVTAEEQIRKQMPNYEAFKSNFAAEYKEKEDTNEN